ncbi:hypothetical protein AK830_g9904 [Neonectria ditissima]|uniref:Uncharacterized protein n=1 Tax=Neonectria ditissima TaxID=78410 RepID=A0A0P7BBH6_9HYPO|nr:hypothetical protein AK830_g9904 [Neonectria ditissima]
MKKEKYVVDEGDDAPLVPRFGVALQFCLPTSRDSCSSVGVSVPIEHAIARRTAQLIQKLPSAGRFLSLLAHRLCGGVLSLINSRSPCRRVSKPTRERHYSYECKASSQDRPYVSRPSRSQQLRNPKLVPKLTNDAPNPLERKQGVADEQLAKAESERARKREREEREDELINESSSKRQRSVSSHSVSTISTGASRSPSPPRRRTRTPILQQREQSPRSETKQGVRDGRRDYSSSRSRSRSHSSQPQQGRRRSLSRDSRSPDPGDREKLYRFRDAALGNPERDDAPPRRSRRESLGSRDSFDSRRHRVRESRSPEPPARQSHRLEQHNSRRGRGGGPRGRSDGNAPASRGPPLEERPRERSLSPFSRRLAITQAQNMEGR